MKTYPLDAVIEIHGLGCGHEFDCIIAAYYKDLAKDRFFDLNVVLVGLDLWGRRGDFFVFLDGERNALKIPVKKVLVETNSAGSVPIDGGLLERTVKQVVVKAL